MLSTMFSVVLDFFKFSVEIILEFVAESVAVENVTRVSEICLVQDLFILNLFSLYLPSYIVIYIILYCFTKNHHIVSTVAT